MDNEEIQGKKFSEFPSVTPGSADEVVGLHAGDNARFTVANFILAIRQGLANLFVPLTRTINNKALSSDITLDASDVGAVDADNVGVAGGVASLGNDGKVPSVQLPAIASTAADVTYDNTQSGLTADDVQEAIDELAAGAGGGGVDPETIAPVEESTTATTAHPLGTVFYFNDLLYRALANIPVGGTINTAAGGNATQTSIAQNFKRTVTLTSAEYAQLSAAEKAADIVYIITDDNTIPAEDVSYDPTTSGLTATDVQAATDELANGKANQSQLATVETGSTASRNYAVGEYFCLNGLLYRATAAISSGGQFTPGTNCEQKYATGMAVRWVDISGTSGGSSAVSVTALSGVNSVSGIILAVVDNNATVTDALSLSFYKSGNSWGAALVDMNGNRKANTAFDLRLYYVLI